MNSSMPKRARRSERALDVLEDATGIAAGLFEKARTRMEFLYGEVARTWPGFIARPGQHQMMP